MAKRHHWYPINRITSEHFFTDFFQQTKKWVNLLMSNFSVNRLNLLRCTSFWTTWSSPTTASAPTAASWSGSRSWARRGSWAWTGAGTGAARSTTPGLTSSFAFVRRWSWSTAWRGSCLFLHTTHFLSISFCYVDTQTYKNFRQKAKSHSVSIHYVELLLRCLWTPFLNKLKLVMSASLLEKFWRKIIPFIQKAPRKWRTFLLWWIERWEIDLFNNFSTISISNECQISTSFLKTRLILKRAPRTYLALIL